ncbi:MAG: peptidylprolyl isomerase [Patescibacteria group bacterium]
MTTNWRIALIVAIPLLLTGCQPAAKQTTNKATPAGSTTMNNEEANQSIVRTFDQAPGTLPDDQIKGKDIVLTTNKGEIRFKLFADEAPLTVSNFVFLASQRFYDGLTFHRVEPGFVIQGGDPEGSGRGGPGYKFADEPVKRSYTRGIVAMANSGPNTNGSQFFIMLGDTPLPPAYTIFGEVTAGIEVVDQIRVGDTMTTVTVVDSE